MSSDRKPGSAKGTSDESSSVWILEDLYPEVGNLLKPSLIKSASDLDVLIVLDTNVLLIPFNVGERSFNEITEALAKLAEQGRLRVPDRVIREYLKNRDTRLGYILNSVKEKSNTIDKFGNNLPHFLHDLEEALPVLEAEKILKQYANDYKNSLKPLIEKIKAWRGNDPVTTAYHKIFDNSVIFKHEPDREQTTKDWQYRLANKIPPGYKDASKPDTGVGDFLVWLAILEIGKSSQKDVIFVTGEEKADWHIRSNGEGIYPRPELVDEFRRMSGGHNIQLLKLADLLQSIGGVTEDTVEDIRHAESIISETKFDSNMEIELVNKWGNGTTISKQHFSASFDYLQGGVLNIHAEDLNFALQFSPTNERSFRINVDPFSGITNQGEFPEGSAILNSQFGVFSSSCTASVGDILIIMKHRQGTILAVRIRDIDFFTDKIDLCWRSFKQGEFVRCP
jgi:hypothetical protein